MYISGNNKSYDSIVAILDANHSSGHLFQAKLCVIMSNDNIFIFSKPLYPFDVWKNYNLLINSKRILELNNFSLES